MTISVSAKRKIIEIAELMKKLLDNDYIVPEGLNSIISSFVLINDLLDKHGINIESKDKLANQIVDTIESYNNSFNDADNCINASILRQDFNIFFSEVERKLTINIIVYGINDFTFNVTNLLHNYVNILGYIDDHSNNVLRENSPIISENELLYYDYDYLIIISNNNRNIINRLIQKGINSVKIIDFLQCTLSYMEQYKKVYGGDYYHSKLYTAIKKVKRDNDYEVMISGLSYSLRGVVEKLFRRKAIKLTLPSQDLYYDYVMAKEILCKETNIKYCIIGLSYYSFDWDLSLTSNESSRILNVYYPIFKDSHHLQIPDDYLFNTKIENIDRLIDNRIEEVFIDDIYSYFIERVLKIDLTPDFADELWNKSGYLMNSDITNIDESDRNILGRERAELHNKLNYPQTEYECKSILSSYLGLLKQFNIKPILVVFPTTKYYYQNFDVNIIDRFYSIIEDLNKCYDFQLIDMFKSEQFVIDDFIDWDHLNKKGAIKMTEVLNSTILW